MNKHEFMFSLVSCLMYVSCWAHLAKSSIEDDVILGPALAAAQHKELGWGRGGGAQPRLPHSPAQHSPAAQHTRTQLNISK